MALALVGLGSAIAAGGPAGVAELARLVWAHLDLLLASAATVVFVAAVAPRGTLMAPLVLALAAAGVYAWRHRVGTGPELWALIGTGAVAAGGWLTMSDTNDRDVRSLDPVLRRMAVLLPRTIRVVDRPAPDQLLVLAVGGRVRVDLSEAKPPRGTVMELVLTCCAAQVEVAIPRSWAVVGGRLATAHGVRFTGQLDEAQPMPYPDEPVQRQALVALAEARRSTVAETAKRSGAVVIHALGFGGRVSLLGR
jgi:hypothetical protein